MVGTVGTDTESNNVMATHAAVQSADCINPGQSDIDIHCTDTRPAQVDIQQRENSL